MTQESVQKYQKEIEALGRGEAIESRYFNLGDRTWSEWQINSDPSFDRSDYAQYRAVPPPPKPREFWLVYQDQTPPWGFIYKSEAEALMIVAKDQKPIHVREVI